MAIHDIKDKIINNKKVKGTAASMSKHHVMKAYKGCHMNTDPILNDYRAVDICHSRLSERRVEHQGHSCVLQHRKFDDVPPFCLLCVQTPCFSCNPIRGNLRGVRSGDHSGQFCGPLRPIRRSRICSFWYSVACRLKCGVPRHAASTSVIVCRSDI
jgi:hypothetical protein